MENPGKQKQGFARLWELAMMKKPLVIVSLILSALASVVSFVPYLCIYRVIYGIILSLSGENLDAARLISYGWIAVAGAGGNILLYFCALTFSHVAAFGTLYRLKVDFALHLARVPLGFHVLTGSGKLRKITDENIEKIETFIAHQLPDFIAAVTATLVMLAILFVVDWRFGAAATAGIFIAMFKQARIYADKTAVDLVDQYQRALADMNNATVEYIRGITVVKLFRQTVHSFRRLRETIQSYTKMIIALTLRGESVYSASLTIINHVFLFLMPVAILAGMYTDDYVSYAGTVLFYLIFTQSVAGVITKVIYANGAILHISGDVKAMDGILAEPELPVPKEPKSPARFDISFQDVTFSYDKEQRTEALSGVSFTAKQGELTAIVGPSGGGKSTVAHLIPRFFDVSGGSVAIGGVDVRDMEIHDLMSKVSFVFQDVFLFRQTVKENIRMGSPHATDEQITEAARSAQCHEFIMALPDRYDTVIGTKGVHLSTGERQRIAIARAMVKDCPIVVLDEATAFSDPENEAAIQKAFERLMRGKTVIMIAHRLSTVRGADQILVMEGGRVVQRGNHDALLAQNGRYAGMWQVYTKTVKWRIEQQKEDDGHV
ncbi:MAG: ABC transporter ATP-binding protein/permease [Spirochaetaceae bacterium]|jgi:ATP-binding cassette subfamily B protein|nr:ABC transporter ATP-binding protein/permease [Spirochaetaceae bacterium]